MKVSIIMSVYNDQNYLEESIQSILKQTYTDFEFLITNDCSTDASGAIIEKYKNKDRRIVYFDNKVNIGLTKSLNNMIANAKGLYVARMDSDDIAYETRLEEQVRAIESTNADIVFSDAIIIDKDSNYVCESWRPSSVREIKKIMPYHSYIIHPSVMMRKKPLIEVGLYNESYKTGQDHELWLRMINEDKAFFYIKKNLLKYRINPSSVRGKKGENYYYKLAKVCLAYNNKRKALSYLPFLEKELKVSIILRCLCPAFLYRRLLYHKGLSRFNTRK